MSQVVKTWEDLTATQQMAVLTMGVKGYLDDHTGKVVDPSWEQLAIYSRPGYPDRLTIIPREYATYSKCCINEVVYDAETDMVTLTRKSIGGVYDVNETYADSLGGRVYPIV